MVRPAQADGPRHSYVVKAIGGLLFLALGVLPFLPSLPGAIGALQESLTGRPRYLTYAGAAVLGLYVLVTEIAALVRDFRPVYALTNLRAVIVELSFRPTWRSFDLRKLSAEKTVRTDGSGDLIFERIKNGLWRVKVGFIAVPDVARVSALLDSAREALLAPPSRAAAARGPVAQPASPGVPSPELEQKKEKLVRRAWKPVTANGEGPLEASRFAGRPWLEQDESWPVCRHCGRPMQLFLQLDLDKVPDAIRGEFGYGLLQLFYCTNSDSECESECEAWDPFAKSVLTRAIYPLSPRAEITIPAGLDDLPAKQIVGWIELDDYPLDEVDESSGGWSEQEWDQIADAGYPLAGDKLAGWPLWVQGVEYPRCPVCGTTMRLVFQIDSEDNLAYMFGDSGCGHISQCPEHKEQIAFGWACS